MDLDEAVAALTESIEPPSHAPDAIRTVLVRLAELERYRIAAEHLADTVEDFAFTTEKDIVKLRAAWQEYVETVDRPTS